MLYSKFLALGALLPLAFAQTNTFTIESEDLSAGTPFDITWTPGSDGPVNLILRQDQGDVNNLAIISIIAGTYPLPSSSHLPPLLTKSNRGSPKHRFLHLHTTFHPRFRLRLRIRDSILHQPPRRKLLAAIQHRIPNRYLLR